MRSDMKTNQSNPPPPPPALGDPAAERPKGKRPWSKPTLRIMRMTFTDGGFNASPAFTEHMQPSLAARTGPTYRAS